MGNQKSANIVDRNIGKKVYELRLSLGKTRQELGDQVGVTHQQLQKYENGINRISASRLYELAKSLGVTISFFFEDMQENLPDEQLKKERMSLEMMRDFQAIPHRNQQEAIRHLVKTLLI